MYISPITMTQSTPFNKLKKSDSIPFGMSHVFNIGNPNPPRTPSITEKIESRDYAEAIRRIKDGLDIEEKANGNSVLILAISHCGHGPLLTAVLEKRPNLFSRTRYSDVPQNYNGADFALWRHEQHDTSDTYNAFKKLYLHILDRYGSNYNNHRNETDYELPTTGWFKKHFTGTIDDKSFGTLTEQILRQSLGRQDWDTFHKVTSKVEGSTSERRDLLAYCLDSSKLSDSSALRGVKEVLRSSYRDRNDSSWPSYYNDILTSSVRHPKAQAVLARYARSTSLWNTINYDAFKTAEEDVYHADLRPTLQVARTPVTTETQKRERKEALGKIHGLEEAARGTYDTSHGIFEAIIPDQAEDTHIRVHLIQLARADEKKRPPTWAKTIPNLIEVDPDVRIKCEAILVIPTIPDLKINNEKTFRIIDKLCRDPKTPADVKAAGKAFVEAAEREGKYCSIVPKEDAATIAGQFVGNPSLATQLEVPLAFYVQHRETDAHLGANVVLLLPGRAGIGKTKLARTMAAELFGPQNIVEVNFDQVRTLEQLEAALKRGGTAKAGKFDFAKKVVLLDELDALDRIPLPEQKRILGFMKPMLQSNTHEQYPLKNAVLVVVSNERLDDITALRTTVGEAMVDRLRQVGLEIKLTDDFRPHVADIVDQFDQKQLYLPEFPALEGVELTPRTKVYFKDQLAKSIAGHDRRVSARELVSAVAQPCRQIVQENEDKLQSGKKFRIDIDPTNGKGTLTVHS